MSGEKREKHNLSGYVDSGCKREATVHIFFLLPVVLFIHLQCFSVQSFGDIDSKDFCPLSNIVELDGTLLCSKQMSLSRINDPVTQDNVHLLTVETLVFMIGADVNFNGILFG